MTIAETSFVEREAAEVLDWRRLQLQRVGYTPDIALTLATRSEVDLHRAVDLLERGCPSDLALAILL
jgi:hypothetical protein